MGYPFLKAGTVYLSGLRAARTNAIAKGDGDILAAVDSMLSLIDPPSATNDGATPKETRTMKTLMIDGISCQVGDGNDGEIIQRHIKTLSDSNVSLTSQLGTATAQVTTLTAARDEAVAKSTTEISTRDAKIVTLEKQVKDSVLTPQALDKLVLDRKVVSDKARAVMADKASTIVVDGKTDDEIRGQVVSAKLGDAAKGWTPEQVKISFDTLTAGIDVSKVADTRGGFIDAARAFSAPSPTMTTDTEAVYDARDKRLENAWKTPAANA